MLVQLLDDFHYAVALDVAEVTFAGETPEVGAGRSVGGSWIPEVIFGSDVLLVEDALAPAVVDGQRVVGIAKTVDEVADDKLVVHAITIRSYCVGELEEVVDKKYLALHGIAAFNDITTGSHVCCHCNKASGVVA